ncbi:hypothetical protein GPS64_14195 [Acinetobacter haemolyticus]|nr:hypothetical protein [Acinetobacter haemolyticus]NAR51821.1 hypothetical protein [Acinetobacter haemolyticus]
MYSKAYVVGIILLVVYALFHRLIYSEILLLLGVLVIEVGFVSWAVQFYVNKIKGKPFYTFSFGIVNLFILWFSNVYAHELIVKSLGLPAEDFTLTLHLLVLICYIPSAIVFTILAFFLVYFLIAILLMFKMLIELLNSFIHPFLVIFGLKEVNFIAKKDHKLILHFFAWGITSLFLIGIFEFIVKNQSLTYPIIRYIAYLADYQQLHNYPQVDKDMKIKLHENGFVSTMEGSGQNLKVIVKKMDD